MRSPTKRSHSGERQIACLPRRRSPRAQQRHSVEQVACAAVGVEEDGTRLVIDLHVRRVDVEVPCASSNRRSRARLWPRLHAQARTAAILCYSAVGLPSSCASTTDGLIPFTATS
jgi:hypothetical protein